MCDKLQKCKCDDLAVISFSAFYNREEKKMFFLVRTETCANLISRISPQWLAKPLKVPSKRSQHLSLQSSFEKGENNQLCDSLMHIRGKHFIMIISQNAFFFQDQDICCEYWFRF